MTEIIEYNKTESALAELRQNYAGVQFEVTNPQGMQAAKMARNTIRTIRIDLEKMRKQIKAPALERSRLIDAEAARITAELVALEKPIEEQIKAEERREQEEREAKERAHKARIDTIMQKLDFISGSVGKAFGKTSLEISAILAGIISYDIKTKGFAEFEEKAEKEKANAIADLKILLAGAEAMERQQVAMQEMEAKQKELEAREQALRHQEEALKQQTEPHIHTLTTELHVHNIEQHLQNLQSEFAEVGEMVEADFAEVEESNYKQQACITVGRKGLDLIASQEKLEKECLEIFQSIERRLGRKIQNFGKQNVEHTSHPDKIVYSVEIYLQ
jgi:tetrahydromethanopterin S-methyltransferase subunit G